MYFILDINAPRFKKEIELMMGRSITSGVCHRNLRYHKWSIYFEPDAVWTYSNLLKREKIHLEKIWLSAIGKHNDNESSDGITKFVYEK